MGLLEGKFNSNFVTTTVDTVLNWGTKSSLFPLILGTACCGIEMMAVGYSRFDILERFGMLFRFSPRQSDLMIVAGTITKKMAPIVKTIYDQMPDPKYVIAVGSCATSGNIYNSYSTLQGVDRVVPVDIYVPGCPPIPEAIAFGILELQRKIDSKTTIRKPIPIANVDGGKKDVDIADIKRPGYIKLLPPSAYIEGLEDQGEETPTLMR